MKTACFRCGGNRCSACDQCHCGPASVLIDIINDCLLCQLSVNLSIAAGTHSAEYDAQRAQTAHTVIEITERDKADILHFFENFRTENTDETVAEIVKEELSAWEGIARSLEETTKIIDSRVWIYLNE